MDKFEGNASGLTNSAATVKRESTGRRLGRVALCILLGVAAGCSQKESEVVETSTTDKPESWALDEPETTYLGQTAAAIAADHGGESGFLLLDRGRDALSWRLILADAAEESIDAMYFLWKNDAAG